MLRKPRNLCVIMFLMSGLVSAGCGDGSAELSDLDASQPRQGISTEHPIAGVGKTACSFTKDEILRIQRSGYYYAAVAPALFNGGRNCGRILTVQVGGACYENHNTNCTKPQGHASLEQFSKASGQSVPRRTAHLFIADLCASCVQSSAVPHVDIVDQSMKGSGPLAPMRAFVERNVQRVKQRGTNRTSQPNNLFLRSVVMAKSCAPGLNFEPWVAKGVCNK